MGLPEGQFHLVHFFCLNAGVGYDMATTRFRFSEGLFHNHISIRI
jgi:hypothetical protein